MRAKVQKGELKKCSVCMCECVCVLESRGHNSFLDLDF